jgi:hypothetical protein
MDRPSTPQLANSRKFVTLVTPEVQQLDGAAHLQRLEKRMQHLKRPSTMALPLQRGADWRSPPLAPEVIAKVTDG